MTTMDVKSNVALIAKSSSVVNVPVAKSVPVAGGSVAASTSATPPTSKAPAAASGSRVHSSHRHRPLLARAGAFFGRMRLW